MGKAFNETVCAALGPLLADRGYSERAPCTFVRDCGASFGTVWLVPGTGSLRGQFMPRLSVGLAALGGTVAVLSTDLHVLQSPQTTAWYSWEDEEWDSKGVSADLISLGLPWLERNTDLQHLAQALEARRRHASAPLKSSWWAFARNQRPPQSVDSNALRFLSYCREAQGRYGDALEVWREYMASLTALTARSPDYERLSARSQELQAKL